MTVHATAEPPLSDPLADVVLHHDDTRCHGTDMVPSDHGGVHCQLCGRHVPTPSQAATPDTEVRA